MEKSNKEYQAGVFEFCSRVTGYIYFGRSKSLDSIIRTTKSKLRKNRFHNKSLQDECNEHGIESYDITKHVPKNEQSVLDLLLELEQESLDNEWYLHNKLDVVKTVEKAKEAIETDKYGIDRLSPSQRRFVELVIEKINKLPIDTMTDNLNSF